MVGLIGNVVCIPIQTDCVKKKETCSMVGEVSLSAPECYLVVILTVKISCTLRKCCMNVNL
jgi:hypothetical protein